MLQAETCFYSHVDGPLQSKHPACTDNTVQWMLVEGSFLLLLVNHSLTSYKGISKLDESLGRELSVEMRQWQLECFLVLLSQSDSQFPTLRFGH